MQPTIYSFEEHQIPLEKIDSHAILVIQKLRNAGYKAYLVGGGVRDLLLNTRPKDFDISTSAKPEEIRDLFRNAILIGRRFRLAHIRFGKKILEVSTFRAGDTEESKLILRDNEWGTEEEDALRRDFTINGLFYDPQTQEIIDYVDGVIDLKKRTLRTIGQPEARFIQDPVRMIRLLKFCARFQLEIDPPTHHALLRCRKQITKSSSARILEELLRMLESGSSFPFFKLIHEYGLLKSLSSPLAHFIDLDTTQKIFQLLKAIDTEIIKNHPQIPDRSILLSALCFPILDLTIKHLAQSTGKIPTFDHIAEETNQLITNLFCPFFAIPRRLRGLMTYILTLQFRFTPLNARENERLRVPRDPTIFFALSLFKFRSIHAPELVPLYTRWTEATFKILPDSSLGTVKRL